MNVIFAKNKINLVMEDEFQNTMEHPLQKGFRRCIRGG